VLKAILDVLPDQPSVDRVVLDFEKAMWAAVRSVLPGVTLMGCAFHWTQALWRKVQELGLAMAYCHDDGLHRFIRKLMALPFLPAIQIPTVFQRLRLQATTPALVNLVDYVATNWIHSPTFPPTDWSVYGQSIRTNNDIEGWHNGLNRCASGRVHLPFYLLVKLLHSEAKLTEIQVRLVSEQKLKRIQRKKYRQLQAKIFALWEQYQSHSKSAMQLLKSCSYLNGPVRVQ
ncbi:hypothetical protein QZH41_012629, partial [Actinostola sp. cb2023]